MNTTTNNDIASDRYGNTCEREIRDGKTAISHIKLIHTKEPNQSLLEINIEFLVFLKDLKPDGSNCLTTKLTSGGKNKPWYLFPKKERSKKIISKSLL